MASASFDPYYKWLGIPPDEQPPNHYRLLGIPLFESDLDVIENAAHRQMVYVRTFQTGRNADLSQKLLNELAAAKVCLMSRSKRAAYDESLRQQLQGENPTDGPESELGDEASSGVSRVNGFDSRNSEDAAGAEESQDTGSGTSWSGEGSEPLLDFSRPATERRERTRGKKATKPAKAAKRGKQPIVAILVLFGGLGVVAVILIVLLVVLIFRKPKEGTSGGQVPGKSLVGPETATGPGGAGPGGSGAGGSGTAGFGAGGFAKPSGNGPGGGVAGGGATGGGDSSGQLAASGSKPASGGGSGVPGSGLNVKIPKPDPSVPSVAGGSESATGSPDTKRAERIRGQFEIVRQALVARDPNRAQATLVSLGGLNRDLELREEKERLEAISRFIGEFWKSVRQGANKVRGRLEAANASPVNDNSRNNNPSGNKPEGKRPDSDRSDNNRTDGGKPNEGKPNGGKPNGSKNDGGKPDGDSNDGDSNDGDSNDGDSNDGDKNDGGKPEGDKPDGDRTEGDKTDSAETNGNKSASGKTKTTERPKTKTSSNGKAKSDTSGDGGDLTSKDAAGKDAAGKEAEKAVRTDVTGAEPKPAGDLVKLEFLGEVFGLPETGVQADFTLNGETWRGPLFDLPPKAAVALALLGMNDSDGFGRFYAAAFLLVDQLGDVQENRELGMALYRHAEMLTGEPNSFILKEFELEEEQLSEAAEKFPVAKLKVQTRTDDELQRLETRPSTPSSGPNRKSPATTPPGKSPDAAPNGAQPDVPDKP